MIDPSLQPLVGPAVAIAAVGYLMIVAVAIKFLEPWNYSTRYLRGLAWALAILWPIPLGVMLHYAFKYLPEYLKFRKRAFCG